jgi:multiple sugar transport system permease protein
VPEWVTAYLLLGVPMLYLATMAFWPLVQEVWLSFTDARLTRPNDGSFVGFDNYARLFSGPRLVQVLGNTVVYTLGTATLSLLMGVVPAVLLNTRFRGHSLARSILATPWAMPGVAAAIIWLWMFNPRGGILNRTLETLSLGQVSWLQSPQMAMMSVVIVTSWLLAPIVMLVTLSALSSVPSEVEEASRIDGATPLSTFRFVTWPHILPTIRLLSLLLTIWALTRWDVISVLTGGGPVNSTATIVVATQQQAFRYQQVGMGAAYAMIGLVLAAMLALGYFLLEQRELKRASR